MVTVDDLQSKPASEGPVPNTLASARKPGQSRKKVVCLTCGKPGVYAPVGPYRKPAWVCTNYAAGCDSYVGCHPGSENALGTLAGPALRAARIQAHLWIDRLWRGKKSPTRNEVYRLIEQVLGVRHFHVAGSDLKLLEQLDMRRQDVETAFGRAVGAWRGQTSNQPPTSAESPNLGGALVDQLDEAILGALFGPTSRRRRWPTDQGGQFAAQRCIQMGLAQSYVDAAGRRWISKKKSPD